MSNNYASRGLMGKDGTTRSYVLSIAGFDPSAGAGVLADVKTFEANGTYGLGVVSALTWQNDVEFEKVEWLALSKIKDQVLVLLQRFKVRYIKIGLINSMAVLQELVHFLKEQIEDPVIVFDPILSASAGYVFHQNIAQHFLDVLTNIFCITPNIPEAVALFGEKDLFTTLTEQSKATNIYLKGGHSDDEITKDFLFTQGQTFTCANLRLPNGTKHGSGCVLSSALTAQLALGYDIVAASELASRYTHQFLSSSETLLGYHKPLEYEVDQ